MITLFGFGPAFGLPDASPFVIKAHLLLKMAGQPYRLDRGGFRKAPKGKLPYIDDEGVIVADSAFIRFHLEKKYGIDFDAGLSAEQRGIAHAVEKLCEDHLYWFGVHYRWLVDENFVKGPARIFDMFPAPLRPLLKAMVRRGVRRTLKGQGTGRHKDDEKVLLVGRAAEALSGILGDKPWIMGGQPSAADATVGAFAMTGLSTFFDTPLHEAMRGHANLCAYETRVRARFFAKDQAPG